VDSHFFRYKSDKSAKFGIEVVFNILINFSRGAIAKLAQYSLEARNSKWPPLNSVKNEKLISELLIVQFLTNLY